MPETIETLINTNEGEVLVLRGLKSLSDFTKNNSLKTMVEKLGMGIQQFGEIMTETYNHWIGKPIILSYPPNEPVEDLIIRCAKSSYDLAVEAVKVTAYAAHTMKTLLAAPIDGAHLQAIDFEAIFVESGEITYRILEGYEAYGHVYWSNNKTQDITLKPGDLMILKRGIARQITEVKHGTQYMYISAPWDIGPFDATPIDIQVNHST
jgi:hypothetical protein